MEEVGRVWEKKKLDNVKESSIRVQASRPTLPTLFFISIKATLTGFLLFSFIFIYN